MNDEECTHADNRVLATRQPPGQNPMHFRRRRCCNVCGHRWTTVELPVEESAEPTGAREEAIVAALMDTLVLHGYVLRD